VPRFLAAYLADFFLAAVDDEKKWQGPKARGLLISLSRPSA
jgi:hypothetical protein